MQNKFVRSLAFACVLATAGACSQVEAQNTTQGAIAGTVFDATGAAVPNALIVIHDEGTNTETRVTAGASGEFKAPLLNPGTYTVTITAPTFSVERTSGVVVQVQQVTEFNPHLVSGSESSTVQVTADIPAINFESPDFGGHLSNREIENIPINNRRWSTLALTTPGVTIDSNGFGLLQFRAIAPTLNNVQIDGADDNQAFFSEERGRTRAGYSTSQAMVREFQVNTGVYSAEFGRAVGGVVNSVTKTGTNKLHGEAYFYRRDDELGAFNPYTTLARPNANGVGVTVSPFKPKDKRNQYGFNVGGPLRKDRVFFEYAFDVFDRQFPGVARANNPVSFFRQCRRGAAHGCELQRGYRRGGRSAHRHRPERPGRFGHLPVLDGHRGLPAGGAAERTHGGQHVRQRGGGLQQPAERASGRPWPGAAVWPPEHQHAQDQLADHAEAQPERSVPPAALGFAGWRADRCQRHRCGRLFRHRLRQAGLRPGQAGLAADQQDCQRSALPVRPRAER